MNRRTILRSYFERRESRLIHVVFKPLDPTKTILLIHYSNEILAIE